MITSPWKVLHVFSETEIRSVIAESVREDVRHLEQA